MAGHETGPGCRWTGFQRLPVMARRGAPAGPLRSALFAAALAGSAFSVPAQEATAVERLALRHHCLACHSFEQQAVGPAFRAVAARYAAQPGAGVRLAVTIVEGGSGHWGSVRMPPNAGVSAEEARLLADWILSLAPP